MLIFAVLMLELDYSVLIPGWHSHIWKPWDLFGCLMGPGAAFISHPWSWRIWIIEQLFCVHKENGGRYLPRMNSKSPEKPGKGRKESGWVLPCPPPPQHPKKAPIQHQLYICSLYTREKEIGSLHPFIPMCLSAPPLPQVPLHTPLLGTSVLINFCQNHLLSIGFSYGRSQWPFSIKGHIVNIFSFASLMVTMVTAKLPHSMKIPIDNK